MRTWTLTFFSPEDFPAAFLAVASSMIFFRFGAPSAWAREMTASVRSSGPGRD
jgi:hypothetical protein